MKNVTQRIILALQRPMFASQRLFASQKLIAVILISLALLAGCDKKTLLTGNIAPDFVLNEVAGKSVSLSDYRGKVILLEFWATWCPPCRAAVPGLRNLYFKYKDRGFVLLAVSQDRDISTVGSYVKEAGIPYPVLFDNKDVKSLYGIRTIPVTFLIDREGRVAKKHVGYALGMSEILAEEIEVLL